jgi:AbrB family looped-hinge helix DNA binding protein
MKATIDAAGRLVIPKQLRDRLGLTPGEVEVEADGAELRVRPTARDDLEEQDGWLVIPATGGQLSDHDVRRLRDTDQR